MLIVSCKPGFAATAALNYALDDALVHTAFPCCAVYCATEEHEAANRETAQR